MSDNKPPLHQEFGKLLAGLRQRAGIPHQSTLAALIGCKQQTVNRWEAGVSRPRGKQIPQLAQALAADVNELMRAAGYAPESKSAVTSFDQPFPIDRLTPDSFERFCLYFLERHYLDARVHRLGGSGHAQDGLDLEVILPGGVRYGFQCKRVEELGPQKVHVAVAKHSGKARKNFLLLSRIASPQAREAIRQHKGWDIWDKEDISLRIRQLQKHEQRRLVDVFFPMQRWALIGETESSPWQTAEEFFAPFGSEEAAFRHTWQLVGRVIETQKLLEALADDRTKAVFLTGSGGSGKSRILKEVVERCAFCRPPAMVRFLSPTEEATNKSLHELGDADKLLVVDDAHDRSDLPVLFQYAATPPKKTKLFLSFRPYGLDYIRSQAGSFALAGNNLVELNLPPLSIAQATELAEHVLRAKGGPIRAAKDIAQLTLDCPLATVIGAQVVAKDKWHAELIKNEDTFRITLLGKFQDIITGDVGGRDAASVQRLLRVLALVQPFHPDDDAVSGLAQVVEGLPPHETIRFIRLLTEAGVLFKRGGQYRLSPDLLADHIIESACIGPSHSSTGYAERVFEAARDHQVGHLLLNLGKLDWRLANGNPSNSRLLDGIWRKLRPSRPYSDPHVRAVIDVAYYQPQRALTFAEGLIREGANVDDLPTLIKYAAYNYGYVQRACECLWELGKADDRDLHRHPGHAIRILEELCAIKPNKPVLYNESIVDFGLSLLRRDDAWAHRYSPFDILKGILQPEGHTTTSHGRGFAISKFSVSIEAVAKLRARVVDVLISTLTHSNPRAAVLAARALHLSLRFPMDSPEENIQKWTKEFLKTFVKLESTIETGSIASVVLVEIAHAVSWHANYGREDTKSAARRILKLLPRSLEFRTLYALIDGYGQLIERHVDFAKNEASWNLYLSELTAEIVNAYPDGEALREFIEKHIARINAYCADGKAAPHILIWRLVNASLVFSKSVVADAAAHTGSLTKQFAGIALSKLLNDNHANGLSSARQFLESNDRGLQGAVGQAFSLVDLVNRVLTAGELAILREALSAKDAGVAQRAVGAIRTVAKDDHRLAIDLLQCVDLGISSGLADDAFVNLASNGGELFRALSDEDIKLFLDGLASLPELDGHWVETFLAAVSKDHAQRLARFFMDRVDRAADNQDWRFRPCNFGPYGHVPLRFRESPDFAIVLRQVSEWLKSRDDLIFKERSAQLFDTMFKPFDDRLVDAFQNWSDTGALADILAIAKLLSQAHPEFIFQQRAFVVRFLERAKQFGKPIVDAAISALFASAIGGVRSGNVGEPTPRDLHTKAEARKALEELPRFSPAYELYEAVGRNADESIKRSIRDGEAFEE
jgi:transcriptional regulator with XRE-family HTH domain